MMKVSLMKTLKMRRMKKMESKLFLRSWRRRERRMGRKEEKTWKMIMMRKRTLIMSTLVEISPFMTLLLMMSMSSSMSSRLSRTSMLQAPNILSKYSAG